MVTTMKEEVSRYIRHKFSKYNLDTMRLNVKNEIYPNMLSKWVWKLLMLAIHRALID